MPAIGQWTYLGVSPASGGVWSFHDGGEPPRELVSDIHSFTSLGHYDRYPCVRVAGNHHNASFLLYLQSLKQRDEIDSLEICSPNLGGNRSQQADLMQSLQVLATQSALSSSLGGWRKFSYADNCVFSLVRLRQGDSQNYPAMLGFLRAHPVWPFWSFLVGADHVAMAGLLAEIVDPRFFCDSHNPESMATRLEQFLGYSSAEINRAQLLLRAAGISEAPSPIRHPLAERLMGFLERKSLESGVRAAARLAISYLAETWRASLHRDWRRLFIPNYFFESDSLALAAFLSHMGELNSSSR